MRVARRLLHALIIVLTLVVGAAAAAVIVSQTAWFKNWLRGYIVQEANRYLNGTLSIQRLGGNLFFGVELENIGLSMDGSEVVAVKDLGLDYSVFELISKGLSVSEIRLNKPIVYLRREGDTWSIARLIKKQEQEADREGPAYPIAIDAIGISDASVIIDDPVGTSGVDVPDRIERIDADLSFNYAPVHYTIEISHVSFRGSEPAIGLNSLSGIVAVRDDAVHVENVAVRTEETSIALDGAVQEHLSSPTFNLRMSSDKFSVSEIARLVPALSGVRLQPAFEVQVGGPLDRLGVDMNVRSSAGEIRGSLIADVTKPGQSVKGNVSVRHLDLSQIVVKSRQKTDLTADLHADLTAEDFAKIDSLRGTVSVNAPRLVAAGYATEQVHADATIKGRRIEVDARARAYGAGATATGRVTLANETEALSYDLRGRARKVDLRRLPAALKVPPAATDINADYRVRGTEPAAGNGRRAVTAEARFVPSTVAGARIENGSVVNLTMRGDQIEYQADATVSGLDLQRVGQDFNVPALADERYKSLLNGHVTASGRGQTPAKMNVTASGRLAHSTLMGGQVPELTFDATLADDTAHVKAAGTFADFDPAVVSGKSELQGSVGGSLDVTADIAGVSTGVTPENVRATAKIELSPSTVGGLAIERASVDGDYRDRTGDIRQLEIVGRDLNAKASGTLALNDTGASNLTFHADSPRLEEIGKLVGQPISGIAKIDGTVTGNRSSLQAQGTLVGNGIKHGDNGALALTTNYTAKVPELAFERATVAADTQAMFVTVAGQNINELKAKTTYEGKELAFDVTARQPERALDVAGAVTLHPDHQEIHLRRLALDTRGAQWQLADGGNSTVKYAGEAISVENVRLASGDQQIAADGAFGRPGDALNVSLTNVDLAGVDALMLRPPQLTGRLDAKAVVTGSRAEPQVNGDFRVNQGGFRQFKYDTLGGTVSYAGSGVTVDAKLQQNPTQWITAKGYLPTALFSSAENRPASASANRVDFAVDSSPIDLGLVQGFTEALTGVKGTLEAHVRVTGTAEDPAAEGAVTVRDGVMTVEPNGVTYTNIAAQVELQPDRVRIQELTVLDNHQSALSVTGDLAIDERRVGGVQLYVTADDFKVIDNEMGNVRIQSSLEVQGELKAPRLAGYLGVTTGELKLDEIIAMTGTSPYPTEAAGAESSAEPAAPSVFDALTMDVHLMVPNDLVVKASSIQTPGSPISLGALNLTLGGDLRATKKQGDIVRLVGSVNTIRGNYDFQGRRFEILRDGQVRFEGLDELNPTLDLRTRRIIQGVEARVNVRGTLDKPEIVLSSTPPLEQADILSLIVFNQPVNQLGEGQQISLAQRAQALATGAVAGQLAQSIGNALNLDTFEIDMAPEAGGGPQLTVGQQVGQNLYVRVQQGVGEQSTTNFILEYELTNWLRLQTNVLQGSSTQQSLFRRNQGSGGDLIFFFSY